MTTLRCLVLALLLAGNLASASTGLSGLLTDSSSSYQGPIGLDPALRALEQQPLWRAPLDEFSAVIGPEAVFFLSDGQLTAARLATGEILWRYGRGLSGPVANTGNLVFVAEAGQALALDAETGQETWRSDLQLQRIMQLVAGDSLLIVMGSASEAMVVLDATDGSQLYRFELIESAWPVLLTNGILYLQEYHGEPHYHHVSAHDVTEGRMLWRTGTSLGPIWREDGRIYLHREPWAPVASVARPLEILVIAERSGELLETWSYPLPVSSSIQARSGNVVMTQDEVIALSSDGATVLGFPWGGATGPDWQRQLQGQYRAGLQQGTLLAETREHELRVLHLSVDSDFVLLPRGSPVSRIDLGADRAYVGRIDGLFQVVQLANSRQRFFVRTGTDAGPAGFGPTLRSGEFLVLQTPAELLVVEDIQ
jgi:outer membrane protein assembly factor BamB